MGLIAPVHRGDATAYDAQCRANGPAVTALRINGYAPFAVVN